MGATTDFFRLGRESFITGEPRTPALNRTFQTALYHELARDRNFDATNALARFSCGFAYDCIRAPVPGHTLPLRFLAGGCYLRKCPRYP